MHTFTEGLQKSFMFFCAINTGFIYVKPCIFYTTNAQNVQFLHKTQKF